MHINETPISLKMTFKFNEIFAPQSKEIKSNLDVTMRLKLKNIYNPVENANKELQETISDILNSD